MEENIEIKRILDIAKSKIVWIICTILVFVLLGYFYSYHYITPKYKATSTMLLIPNSVSENKSITTSDLTLNSELIETYSNIAKNTKILEQVISNLGLEMTPEELLGAMEVTALTDTYIIEISVTDTDAQKAMDITKELSNVFLSEIKQIYNLDNIGVVDEAKLPEQPYNINHIKDLTIFFMAGCVASSIIIMLIYVWDNTIKKEEDIEKYVKIKSLGSIPLYKEKKEEIIDRRNAKSHIVECINTIRTNILYMNSTKNAKTILITSCTPKEGKSWVSANTAVSFADTNKKVLLIDCDMRKGRAHKIFKVSNQEGLSNYLFAMTGDVKKDFKLAKDYIKETKIPNLHILTNGIIPPNPSELIDSDSMKELISLMKNIYDIIIIDAPPCKLVTDSIILSTLVDSTILVANSEKTRMNEFKSVKEAIQNVGGEVIGAILNKTKLNKKGYGKSYYYGHGNSQNNKTEIEEKEIISVLNVMKQALPELKKSNFDINVEEKQLEQQEINLEPAKIPEEKYENIKPQIQNIYKEIKEVKINYAQDLKDILQIQEKTQKILKDQENNQADYKEQIAQIQEQTQKIVKEQEEKQDNNKEQISKINEEIQKMLQQQESAQKNYNEQINQMKEQILEQQKVIQEENKEQTQKIVKEQEEKQDNNKEQISKINEEIQKMLQEQENNKVNYKEQIEQMQEQILKQQEIVQTEYKEQMEQMQAQTYKILQQQEIVRADYREQIMQIQDTLVNLKDSYLELANRMRAEDSEKEEIPNKTNIIDLRKLKERINKKKVYSINEDISYRDLEKTAVCILPITTQDANNSLADENYKKSMLQ